MTAGFDLFGPQLPIQAGTVFRRIMQQILQFKSYIRYRRAV
jgi:hypothetical protein